MKALLKPIVWVCLFFFAYQSTYAQALKIMSYNCRMSGEMTGYSVKEYAVFIRKYNPDVVMLQEIDYNTKRNKNQDFTTQLAAELGLFSVFGKAMDTGGGEYGVAILSKYPFVYINNKTHLDHSTDLIRSAMAEQINERIGTGDTPTLLGGDFNARTDSNVICEVMKNWQRICDDTFTYPADQPTIKIDYIFGLPQNKWKVKSFKVLSNPEVSDHRALFAEVEFVK